MPLLAAPPRRPASVTTTRRVALTLAGIVAAQVLGEMEAPAAAAWIWPVRGELVTGYANRGGPYAGGQHRGIDVAAPVGTPVVAATGGTVRFAGQVGSAGLTVSVRTADGRFDTSYLHLASADVRAGEPVAAGQRIGTAGATGRPSSPRPHLHFGVRVAGSAHGYRDPLAFLPPHPAVRDVPRGAPLPVGAPVRVGPAPQRVRSLRFEHVPAEAPAPAPAWRRGWAIACAALIAAAALMGAGPPQLRRRRRSVAARLATALRSRPAARQ